MPRPVNEPRSGARARRNASAIAGDDLYFVNPNSGVIILDGDGFLDLTILSTGGLFETANSLSIKLDANPGLVLAAGGLSIAAATATVKGGILEAASRSDSSQDTVSLTAVTSPGDAPATADALRDDLVANTIPDLSTRDTELETAIETLATEFNSLLAKLRTSGALAT